MDEQECMTTSEERVLRSTSPCKIAPKSDPVVFKLWAVFLSKKSIKIAAEVKIRCHQNLIIFRVHRDTYSYRVTSNSDSTYQFLRRQTDRQTDRRQQHNTCFSQNN